MTSISTEMEDPDFPGGPYNRKGFNFTQWLTDLIMDPIMSNASPVDPLPPIMAGVVLNQVIAIISQVGATIIDIVPPLIPPPFWINRPLPCVPMVTGRNCLGSVLYPITMADFAMAHLTDQGMDQHLVGFPQKYATLVGTTTNKKYELCARVYLGLQCAKLFPMCLIFPGQMSMTAFPVCFPLCILTLLACPGFGFESILDSCSDISIPPFCAFSIYVKSQRVPGQYASFEEAFTNEEEDCPQEIIEHIVYTPEIGVGSEKLITEIVRVKPPPEGGEFEEDTEPTLDKVEYVPSCDCNMLCHKEMPKECEKKCETICNVQIVKDINEQRRIEQEINQLKADIKLAS